MGAKTTYTKEMGDALCELIEDGMGTRAAARKLGIPSSTAARWAKADHEGFREQYARALNQGAHARAESIKDDYEMEPERGPDGKIDHGFIQWQKLRIDTKKWEASRMLPKVYGDKLELAGDAAAPLTVVVRRLTDKLKSDE